MPLPQFVGQVRLRAAKLCLFQRYPGLVMRILIVKLGSIGDIVHTLPALSALRGAMPQAEISWVVERPSAEILKDNPLLDRLIEVDTKALRRGLMSGETLRAPRQQLRRLRASAFDLSPKSPVIARLSGARRFSGPAVKPFANQTSDVRCSYSFPSKKMYL